MPFVPPTGGWPTELQTSINFEQPLDMTLFSSLDKSLEKDAVSLPCPALGVLEETKIISDMKSGFLRCRSSGIGPRRENEGR